MFIYQLLQWWRFAPNFSDLLSTEKGIMGMSDGVDLEHVVSFVRSPVVFAEEYKASQLGTVNEIDIELQQVYQSLIDKKLTYIITLQEMISQLDDKKDEVSDFQRREMGELLRDLLR